VAELRLDNSIVDDRYLIERCLGRGSYAEIFLAYDQNNGSAPVIIKALNMTLQGTPDYDLERTLIENFQNEAIALDKVRHPHIIRRLGHGTAADLAGVPFHYLVLEYMPGGDLLNLCRRQPMTLADALHYFQQVAEALAHAHDHQVIHRDIKPNNLLLTEDRRTIKVADFGVAKMTPGDADEITRVGTNVYAPPEHHPDSANEEITERLTPSADVYSLAKTVYTAMTGRAPRQFSRHPITEIPAELAREPWGDDLLALLRKATSTRVADRYQSVREFWQAFARLPIAEGDEDETVVRSRLATNGAVGRAAARPNFQALTSAPLEGAHPQKARIVVELPQRSGQGPGIRGQGVQTVAVSDDRSTPATVNAPQVAARRQPAAAERSFWENLRATISSDWLRRAFIIFLIFALVGLAISTYYHFAARRGTLPQIFGSQSKTGVIAFTDVNLRSAPNGEKLEVLPRGSQVRVLENSGGWSRVEVSEWSGGKPEGAPDMGWVKSDLIKLD
jgi:serine/threonine protein kinase